MHWIPAHSGIPGNEQADAEAKAASESASPHTPEPRTTLVSAKRQSNAWALKRFWNYRTSNAPAGYRALGVKLAWQPIELTMPHMHVGAILTSRSGYGDFAECHEKWNHHDACNVCPSGPPKVPDHFYWCRRSSSPLAGYASGRCSGNRQWLSVIRTVACTVTVLHIYLSSLRGNIGNFPYCSYLFSIWVSCVLTSLLTRGICM